MAAGVFAGGEDPVDPQNQRRLRQNLSHAAAKNKECASAFIPHPTVVDLVIVPTVCPPKTRRIPGDRMRSNSVTATRQRCDRGGCTLLGVRGVRVACGMGAGRAGRAWWRARLLQNQLALANQRIPSREILTRRARFLLGERTGEMRAVNCPLMTNDNLVLNDDEI